MDDEKKAKKKRLSGVEKTILEAQEFIVNETSRKRRQVKQEEFSPNKRQKRSKSPRGFTRVKKIKDASDEEDEENEKSEDKDEEDEENGEDKKYSAEEIEQRNQLIFENKLIKGKNLLQTVRPKWFNRPTSILIHSNLNLIVFISYTSITFYDLECNKIKKFGCNSVISAALIPSSNLLVISYKHLNLHFYDLNSLLATEDSTLEKHLKFKFGTREYGPGDDKVFCEEIAYCEYWNLLAVCDHTYNRRVKFFKIISNNNDNNQDKNDNNNKQNNGDEISQENKEENTKDNSIANTDENNTPDRNSEEGCKENDKDINGNDSTNDVQVGVTNNENISQVKKETNEKNNEKNNNENNNNNNIPMTYKVECDSVVLIQNNNNPLQKKSIAINGKANLFLISLEDKHTILVHSREIKIKKGKTKVKWNNIRVISPRNCIPFPRGLAIHSSYRYFICCGGDKKDPKLQFYPFAANSAEIYIFNPKASMENNDEGFVDIKDNNNTDPFFENPISISIDEEKDIIGVVDHSKVVLFKSPTFTYFK